MKEFNNELYHHKYVMRVRTANGKWRYIYDNDRPLGREKNVTGQGKTIKRRKQVSYRVSESNRPTGLVAKISRPRSRKRNITGQGTTIKRRKRVGSYRVGGRDAASGIRVIRRR